MKQILITLINIYQIVLSPILRQIVGVSSACRYSPTCSEFAKTKIREYGIIRGGKMSLKRLLSCHPFAKKYGKSL